MSVKPIIEVEVNDSDFKRFYELFSQYRQDVEDQPGLWKEAGDSMDEAVQKLSAGSLTAKESLAIAAAQATMIAEALRDASKAQQGLERHTTRSAHSMHNLAKSAQSVGKAISFVGNWVVKLGAIGGLGTIFSGLGIGALASSAFSRNRSAGQIGISPGELASFQVNAQQFLSTGALQSAANQQLSYQSIPYFQMLGFSWRRAMQESPVDLAFQEYRAAAVGYQQARKAGIPFLQTRAGIAAQELGLDPNAIRNIAHNLSEFDLAVRETRRDVGQLGFDKKTADEWTALKKELDRAGIAIETDLINKLGPLAPKIERLTEGVVNAVAAFIGGKNFDIVIEDAKKGLGALADFVIHTNWDQIGKNVSAFGKDVQTVAGWLSWLNPVKNAKDVFTPAGWKRDLNSPENQGTIKALQWLWKTAGDKTHAILNAITGQESGGNYGAYNRSSGASGRYQFMPGTAASYLPGWWRKQYGNTILDKRGRIRSEWTSNTGGVQDAVAIGYYDMLERHAYKLSHVHNNAALIAAGWYGGIGGMDAYYHHAGWTTKKQGQFPSVSDYVRDVVQRLRSQEMQYEKGHPQHRIASGHGHVQNRRRFSKPPVHVSVTNSTAARVAVSVNAAAVT